MYDNKKGILPDFAASMGPNSPILLLESDEGQHTDKPNQAEEDIARDKRVALNYPDKKLIIIRFNPDDYTDASGNEILGPFGTDVSTCKRTKALQNKKEWERRLTALKKLIDVSLQLSDAQFKCTFCIFANRACTMNESESISQYYFVPLSNGCSCYDHN